MSKAVKRVGNFVRKVVKGAVKVVKKVWDNKIGRIVMIAAAAMVLGPMVGQLAGQASFAEAWAAGVGNLTSTLSGVGSALSAGEFGTAASTLGQGLIGGNVPAATEFASTITPAATVAPPVGNPVDWSVMNAGAPAAAGTGEVLEGAAANVFQSGAPAASSAASGNAGLFQSAYGPASALDGAQVASNITNSTGGGSWFSRMMASPYAAPAALMTGGQMVSSLGQGLVQENMLDEQERQKNEDIARYNRNTNVKGIVLPTIYPGYSGYSYGS